MSQARSNVFKLRDIVNVKDPAFGAKGDGVTDDTAAIQAAIDACAFGQTLYAPTGLYKHTGLTVAKSIKIVGDLPAHQFDNDSFNALNGGTRFWQSASTGNNVTVSPPNLGDRRIQVNLENLLLIGAKYNGTDLTGTPTSGSGLVVDGRQQAETAVHLTMRNVFSSYHKDHGFSITGAVYGSHSGFLAANGNGKNNFRIVGQSDPVGEFSVEHLRCFAGGADGATDIEKAGIYVSSGSTFKFGFITSSGALGAAMMLGGGAYEIGTLHSETPGGTPGATHVIFQAGDGTSNPTAAMVRRFDCSPGTNYVGTTLKVKNGARRVRVDQFTVNDVVDTSGTGKHIEFESGAESCVVRGLSVATSGGDVLKVTDTDGDNYVETLHPAFFAFMSAQMANATGDSTQVVVAFDTVTTPGFDISSSFNTSTYLFTAPIAGVYRFEAMVQFSGADGVNHTNFGIILDKNSGTTVASNELRLVPTLYFAQVAATLKLTKGDTLRVKAYAEGGGKTVEVGNISSAAAYFSGALITPGLGNF